MTKVYNRIENISGSVITVRATGVKNEELAVVNTRFGKSLAQVSRIDGDRISLQVFAGGRGVATDDEVRFWVVPCALPLAIACLAVSSTVQVIHVMLVLSSRRILFPSADPPLILPSVSFPKHDPHRYPND